jgi:flagellar assembly protein FliH
MVKIASQVAFFGPLRDIRLSDFKPCHNGALGSSKNHGHGHANGNGHGHGSLPHGKKMPQPGAGAMQTDLEAARAAVISEDETELPAKKAAEQEDSLRLREQAGYERGRMEAEKAFAERIEQLRAEWETEHRTETVRALERLNREVHDQMAETCKTLEKHLVNLAVEAAIRLVCNLPISSEMVEASVQEAVSQAEQCSEITVLLHPEDYALLEEHKSSLLNRAGSFPVVRFRPDNKLSRGGCMVETTFGEIDARRETRIELLRKAVNE